jgi:hypothetical protein
MKNTNQSKRGFRKSNLENIYLSGEELIETIEISKNLYNYPFSSIFQMDKSFLEFIYRISNKYRWKLELKEYNRNDERLCYTIKTTSNYKRINKYLLVIELEEQFVMKLLDDLNR